MNKLMIIFLFFLLFIELKATGDGECLNAVYDESESSGIGVEEFCLGQTTSENNLMCKYNKDLKSCEELPRSECLTTFLESNGRRRISTQELTEEDCQDLQTSDKYNRYCGIILGQNRCKEYYFQSDCVNTIKTKYDNYVFSNEDCEKFETSDPDKLKCVPSKDKHYCVQESGFFNRFNFILLNLCLLFLF